MESFSIEIAGLLSAKASGNFAIVALTIVVICALKFRHRRHRRR
jgi:hypothetical protein